MEPDFVEECLSVLTRTPATLDALLGDLPDAWTAATEGPGTWSPFVVIGHLIHAEKADWIPRLAIILEYGTSRPFEPFDREAQLRERDGKSLPALLQESLIHVWIVFARLRAMHLTPEKLELRGDASRTWHCNCPAADGDVDRARFGSPFANQSRNGQAL